jgi:glutathione S-transferase
MKLYFSPLACSMATRIALDEAGASATFIEVDPYTHRTLDGSELREVAPLAQVPALRTDEGEIITENAAVLQYVARRFPQAHLAPAAGMEQVHLQEWLCFVGTELHKLVFTPLLDRTAPEGAKAYALTKASARLSVLEAHLANREYLLDGFSVADAYLITVLNWVQATAIDLSKFPAVSRYQARLRARPSVARALAIELPLYLTEQQRHAAA